MILNRVLNYRHGDVTQKILLEFEGPLFDEEYGWHCQWKCEKIHPRPLKIPGQDEIGALYYCLTAIGHFISEMQKMGREVWYEDPGDFGGFCYGQHKKEDPE